MLATSLVVLALFFVLFNVNYASFGSSDASFDISLFDVSYVSPGVGYASVDE